MTLFPRVVELLVERDATDVVVFGGGIVPAADIITLKEKGLAEDLYPGSALQNRVQDVVQTLIDDDIWSFLIGLDNIPKLVPYFRTKIAAYEQTLSWQV